VLFGDTSSLLAADYHGRVTTGGLLSKESFLEESAGSKSNDVAVISNRFYLNIANIGRQQFGFVADLRDKHDFFDKLDREQLELKGQNSFQMRQLYLRYPNPGGGFFSNLGRFSAFDSGVVYVDGAEFGYRLNPSFKAGAFGGLNPSRESISYLEFNPKAQIGGIFGIYEKRASTWSRYTYSSSAIVILPSSKSENDTQAALPPTEGQTNDLANSYEEGANPSERNYFYNNSIIQWTTKFRLISMLIFDFAPKTQLQNLALSLLTNPTSSLNLGLSAQRINAIEYARQRELREDLKSSQYDEAKLNFNLRAGRVISLIGGASYGKRSMDELTRSDLNFGLRFANLFRNRFEASALYGIRDNFTKNDSYIRFGGTYFSDSYEISIDQEIMTEKRDDGTERNPKTTEISANLFLSRIIFSTMGIHYFTDEDVKITSGFIRLSYRFGNREIPPVRDGSPPRGRL
jgi:hypothetical protein